MRGWIALLATILLAMMQTASASHRTGESWPDAATVVVRDYTGPELDGYIPIIVANWQTAIGSGALTLVYERKPAKPCSDVRQNDGAISVCSSHEDNEPYPAGVTLLKLDGHTITAAKVHLVARDWTHANHPDAGYWWHPMGCHEMGHALGLGHRYTETDSCLGTQMQQPGSHDVEAMKQEYGGHNGYAADPALLPCCPRVTLVTT